MAESKRQSSSIRKHHRHLGAPFVEVSGSYIKSLWIAKSQHYGIESREPVLGYKSDYILGILNTLGSILIAFDFILKPDTILGCILTTVYTLFYWEYGQHLSSNMSWNVISLGIIFPITQAIGMAFKRREQALARFADFNGNLRSLWGGIHSWKVPCKDKNSPRPWIRVIELMGNGDVKKTKDDARKVVDELLTALVCYFNTIRWRRARHVMSFLQPEQFELQEIAHEQRLHVDSCMARLQRLVQDMKSHGLPGGEAHRLDQYVSKCCIAIENLANLKEYRTPQAFRAFARIYIQILGALYGPYYLVIAKGLDENERNVGFAVVFALSIQLTLSGLYHVMLGLEDPFARSGGRGQLDSVRVPEMVEVTRRMLLQTEADADDDWRVSSHDKMMAAKEGRFSKSSSMRTSMSME